MSINLKMPEIKELKHEMEIDERVLPTVPGPEERFTTSPRLIEALEQLGEPGRRAGLGTRRSRMQGRRAIAPRGTGDCKHKFDVGILATREQYSYDQAAGSLCG